MADFTGSLYKLRQMDEMARGKSIIHKIHPLIKCIVTLIYIVTTVSFSRYEILSILPLVVYPVIIISLSEIPAWFILKRVLIVSPFILFLGILNPIFERTPVNIGGIVISAGYITFISLIIKSFLTVFASLLLVCTAGMDNIAASLRIMHVPKIIVMVILLTYRYIFILTEETARIVRAYHLRAPGQKGIKSSSWGSLAGQLLLRTFDRAEKVYESMSLRGFKGEYNTGVKL